MLLAGAAWAQAQQFPPPNQPPSASASPTAAATEENSSPAPLATRQTSFTIPFSVDPRTGASEVQLHVSRDQGKTWSVYSRQKPDAGKFFFRAGDDGEYWFASRTVDAKGQGLPLDKLTPQLRVRVDTAAPKADLVARVGKEGEIIAEWHATDADLVVESVKIEYQGAGDRQWQSVALDANNFQREGTKTSGKAAWLPVSNQRAINLKITARDAAGNAAVVNRGVYLPSVPLAATARPKGPAPLNVDPFQRETGRVSSKPPEAWPDEKLAAKPVVEKPSAEAAFPKVQAVSTPIAGPVAGLPEIGTRSVSEDAIGTRSVSEDAIGTRSVSEGAPANDPPPLTDPPRELDEPLKDSPIEPVYTAKKRFKLDYDSDNIPLNDIASVELWGTHDRGKTWLKWGTDPDRQTPFEVEVDDEGLFGFRVVIAHANGMAGSPPRTGDSPDIWVGVDVTAPAARFGSIAYGRGQNSGQLQIDWAASDENLTARPITLSYSTDPQGPWTPLAAGLANTGQFFWRVEPSVPRKVYLRLDVRDQAGNVSEDRTRDIIELEGLVPRGRIRGVE
jgi:hypothetical protein